MRTIRNATFTTGVTTPEIISEQRTVGKRVVLEINNTNAPGGADVWVAVDEEATANKGRRIQPGQSIIWSTDGGYTPPQGRITSYSTAATILSIYEEIEV